MQKLFTQTPCCTQINKEEKQSFPVALEPTHEMQIKFSWTGNEKYPDLRQNMTRLADAKVPWIYSNTVRPKCSQAHNHVNYRKWKMITSFLDVDSLQRSNLQIRWSISRKIAWSGKYLDFTSCLSEKHRVSPLRGLHEFCEFVRKDRLNTEPETINTTPEPNAHAVKFICNRFITNSLVWCLKMLQKWKFFRYLSKLGCANSVIKWWTSLP